MTGSVIITGGNHDNYDNNNGGEDGGGGSKKMMIIISSVCVVLLAVVGVVIYFGVKKNWWRKGKPEEEEKTSGLDNVFSGLESATLPPSTAGTTSGNRTSSSNASKCTSGTWNSKSKKCVPAKKGSSSSGGAATLPSKLMLFKSDCKASASILSASDAAAKGSLDVSLWCKPSPTTKAQYWEAKKSGNYYTLLNSKMRTYLAYDPSSNKVALTTKSSERSQWLVKKGPGFGVILINRAQEKAANKYLSSSGCGWRPSNIVLSNQAIVWLARPTNINSSELKKLTNPGVC